MKTRDIKDLQTKTIDELKKMTIDMKQAVKDLRLEHAQHKLKNTSSLTHARHDLARVLSVMTGKERSQNG